MIVKFIEASNDFNHGKFLLLRYDADERLTRSALPGYEGDSLLAGRKFDWEMTFVIDLQTGEGAAFTLDSGIDASHTLNEKHRIWVCPLYEPFLIWLSEQGLGYGAGDILELPSYLDLPDALSSMTGRRRAGAEIAT